MKKSWIFIGCLGAALLTSTALRAVTCGYVQRVNSGGGVHVDGGGNVWAADQAYTPGGFGYINGTTFADPTAIAGTTEDPLYQDLRQDGYLQYRFTVPDGQYQVTLKFAELWFPGAGSRVFNMDLQGFRVQTGLDVVAASGAQFTAYDRVFTVNVYGGILNLEFGSSMDQAMLAAIQVIQTSCPTITPTPCLPQTLVITSGTADKVNYMSPMSAAEPGGWQNLGFADGGWPNSVLWPSPTGALIDGSLPWYSHDLLGSSNADDKLLVRRNFTIPAGAVGISATITLAIDDSVRSWANGQPIQADLPSYVSVPGTIRSFLLPPGSLVAGNNTIALHVLSPLVSYIGYSFKLEISYGQSCASPTRTPTPTYTRSPTPTLTRTPTPSVTFTSTLTRTPTPSLTRTPTPSVTFTPTLTRTPTPSVTFTPSLTRTPTPSVTPSPTLTRTPTPSVTITPTLTVSPSPSVTQTPTLTRTPTSSVTVTLSPTSTRTRTPTPTLTFSPTLSSTPSPTRSSSPTLTRTPTSTVTFTPTLTWTPTLSVTPSPSRTATPSFSVTPTPTFSATPSATSTRTSSFTETKTVTPGPTLTFTVSPTPSSTSTQSRTATPSYSVTPTSTFTVTSSATPTRTSSFTETKTVTPGPTLTFTVSPTSSATSTLSRTMTPSSSATPTATPSFSETKTATLGSTPSYTDSPTPSWTFTLSPSATASGTASASPSPTRTVTSSSSATPSLTATSTSSLTSSFTATRTMTVFYTATQTVTASPTATASPSSTGTLTSSPSPSFSSTPSVTPTPSASASVTASFSPSPSPSHTVTPIPMPCQLTVDIYNSAGEHVKKLYAGPSQQMPGQFSLGQSALVPGQSGVTLQFEGLLQSGGKSLVWMGDNDNGQLVQGGTYYAKSELVDNFGMVKSWSQAVTVLPKAGPQSLNIFNSAGELVAKLDLALISPGPFTQFGLAHPDGGAFALVQGAGVEFWLEDAQGAKFSYVWDGISGAEKKLSPGTYVAQLMDSSGGHSAAFSKSFTVLGAPAGADHDVMVGPNPVGPKDHALCIRVNGLAWGDLAQVRLYNLALERVAQGVDASGSGKIVLNLGHWSSGTYVAVVEIYSGGALLSRKLRKIAIQR